ncbi:oxygenase MpaB family protein [Gordonia sp. (in: high G+C Gram-positive bacteria)]|uniref:oxygenase MpaB family protein n=1 Tax=Gordonia sp. (in: high G+C Gram-positive bacteria) TaxID=84139 RepID=UPI0039E26637
MPSPLDRILDLGGRYFDDGLPDFSPIVRRVREKPTAVLNPIDLLFELYRPSYFKKATFAEPLGDPGWFGPDSKSWYVHTHTPSLWLGVFNTAVIDIVHQGIQAAVFDHSKLPGRDADGNVLPGTFSTTGTFARAARTHSFFAGVVYGPTEAAEALSETVRAIHGKVKGVRSDGVAYDADDPEFFRWTYCTVVDGLAAAHVRYHPKPLQGADLDEFYAEYARVGEALGGTDLPRSRAECLHLLATLPSMNDVGLNDDNRKYVELRAPRGFGIVADFAYWTLMDMMPAPVQEAVEFEQPGRVKRAVFSFVARSAVKLLSIGGDLREVSEATRRVQARGVPAPPSLTDAEREGSLDRV